jgi:hypothetical protein
MRFFVYLLVLFIVGCETSQPLPQKAPIPEPISILGMEGQFSISDLELKDLAESGSREQRLAVSQYFRKMALIYRSEAIKQESRPRVPGIPDSPKIDWETKARAYEKVSDALAKSY